MCKLILSSFKKKAWWTAAKSTWDASNTPFTCASNRWFILCIRVLFKNYFFVCSQSDDHDHHPAGLGVIALMVYWSGTSKRFLGFFKPTGVCSSRWKVLPALSATELGFGLSTDCQVRSAVVLQTKQSKKTVSIVVHVRKMGVIAQWYYSLSSDPGISERFWVSNPLVCVGERVLLVLCHWALTWGCQCLVRLGLLWCSG